MSEAGERQRAQTKEDTFASWAKPRLEERVSERRWRPTSDCRGIVAIGTSAARRRAIDCGRRARVTWQGRYKEAE